MREIIKQALEDSCRVVIIDTETTGFGKDDEIIDIAAHTASSSFQSYMFPQKKIHWKASSVTGLVTRDDRLFHYNQPVETVSSEKVAQDFISYLLSFNSQILLVGHNIIRFDAPKIFAWLNRYDLDTTLSSFLYGFTDTIPLLRQEKVAKLELLSKQYLTGPKWDNLHLKAHSALGDCEMLEGLLLHFKISDDILKEKALLTKQYLERQALAKKRNENLPHLSQLKSVISFDMLNRMAQHDLTFEELKKKYIEFGDEGVATYLGVRVNEKPRVTINKQIIRKIISFLKKIVSDGEE